MAAMVFNPAWMNFIRSLLHFQVHGSLYTMIARERRKGEYSIEGFLRNCHKINSLMHRTLPSMKPFSLGFCSSPLPWLSMLPSWVLCWHLLYSQLVEKTLVLLRLSHKTFSPSALSMGDLIHSFTEMLPTVQGLQHLYP